MISERPLPVTAPAPTQQAAKKAPPVKPADPRRKFQFLSSRLIALAGIVILLCAIIPYMHLGGDQAENGTIDTVFLPTSPSNSALQDTFQNVAVAPAEKSETPTPIVANPAPAIGSNAAVPSQPPLLPQAEKKGIPECLVKSKTENKNAPAAPAPTEQLAGPSGAIRPAAPLTNNIPANAPSAIPATHDPASLTTVFGEVEPLRDVTPESAPPTGMPNAISGTSPEMTSNSQQPISNGMPQSPTLSGGAAQGMAGSMPSNPNLSPPFNPPATGMENRGIQQADLRNRVPYPEPYPANNGNFGPNPANLALPPNNLDALPSSRQPLQYNAPTLPPQNAPTYPPSGQVVPQRGQVAPQYGQPLPPNGQGTPNSARLNLPSGEQLPNYHLAGSMNRNAVQQPARSVYSANPYVGNQYTQTYPVPTAANQTAGAMQNGYPATQQTNPYARTAASYNNTNTGNPNGYSIPPVTENTSPRY
jgi:hypothetical protein